MLDTPPPGTSLALDTDVLTWWRNQQPTIVSKINAYYAEFKLVPALTSFTVFEALSGFEKAAKASGGVSEQQILAREQFDRLVANCIVLPFDLAAAEIAALVFSRLSQTDRNKHWSDILIAATVISHRYGLASGNRDDFELIANTLPQGQRLYFAPWKPDGFVHFEIRLQSEIRRAERNNRPPVLRLSDQVMLGVRCFLLCQSQSAPLQGVFR
jgi:predicted nucleic acid-binding protein